VARRGPEAAPLVLLLHGLGAHARWWDFVARPLARRFDVWAPDLRGHGDAPPPPATGFGAVEHARDVARLLEGAGRGARLVIGHSFGGAVAVELARLAPERVGALVLLDVPLAWPARWSTVLRFLSAGAGVAFDSLADAVRAYRPLPRRTLAPPARLRHVARHGFRIRAPGGPWVSKTARAAYRLGPAWDLAAALAGVRAPTLFVRGSESEVVPRAAFLALATRFGVACEEIEGAAHHLPLDAPAHVAALAERFARGLPSRRSGSRARRNAAAQPALPSADSITAASPSRLRITTRP
jgi:pimeloyl-ACP methyl ester carboxylesterase